MFQTKNIGFEFGRVAEANPELQAIVAADITITYGKLWLIVESFASRMREHGIGRSSVVAVTTTDMIASVATLLASCLVGSQYVVPDKQLIKRGDIKPTHYLRSPEVEGISGVEYIVMDQNWAPAFASKIKQAPFEGFGSTDDPWWILSTSGTTGNAKYLHLSQRLAFDRSIAVKEDFVACETRICILFLCATRPFFVRAMAALLNQCTIIDSFDPAFWHDNGVNFVCASPHLIVEWLGNNKLVVPIERLQVSGAKLTDFDAKVLLESFNNVEDIYGSSETNKSFVNTKALGEFGEIITIGVPKDSEIELITAAGTIAKNGETGQVRIRNSYMATGYINDPIAGKVAFQDGWFYPGDIGRFGANGKLEIVGRMDSVINLDGVKIDPARIEETLKSIAGINNAVCFLDPDASSGPRLMAFVILENLENSDQIVREAQEKCVAKFGVAVTPQTILVVPEFPLTNDGVPKREECRHLARELVNVAQWQ